LVAFLLIGGIGFFMLVLTWFLGELFDLGHNVAGFFGDHLGDVTVGDHHVEIGHHGTDLGPAPSALSSRVIFAFMTAFGGAGAVASSYGLSALPSVAVALGAGLLLGGIVYAFSLAIYRQQATSGFDLGSLVGRSARVVVSIPSGGTGQISVGAGGGTSTMLARSHDGSAVPPDRVVRVIEVQGDLLIVEAEPGAPPKK
jgi:membrane protein implicated in regulation of membrane protease activity